LRGGGGACARPRKPRPGGFGHHVHRYYGRCAGCFRWTGTGARRVTPPRAASQETCHKQPGLKSKSRGLETSVKAAAERREASAPEADGPCKRAVRGARRARSANGWQQPLAWRGQFSVCAFRRSASPHFIWRRNNSGFRSCCKLGRGARRENAITFRPRDSGGGGPLELAKRANRGGGGACGAGSLSSQENDDG
jgi:hypothetical protein